MLRAQYNRCLRTLIGSLNVAFLKQHHCVLSGATPVVLSLGDYRCAEGVVLSCFDQAGYRSIRDTVSSWSLGQVLGQPLELARSVRADRFGIRTYLMVDSVPVHFEIFHEHRFCLDAWNFSESGVPTLSHQNMFVERLLANVDRERSSTTAAGPMVDLALMVANWGAIPEEAWRLAHCAYGQSVSHAYRSAIKLLCDLDLGASDARDLSLDPLALSTVREILPTLLAKRSFT